MRLTRAIVVLLALALTRTAGSADQTLFIELPTGVLATDVRASAVVVGSYRQPRGFYWMPTTRDIDIGGVGAAAVSRDGRTIVGTA